MKFKSLLGWQRVDNYKHKFLLYLNRRFGRKKIIVGSLILAAIASVGAVLFTTEDNSNKGML